MSARNGSSGFERRCSITASTARRKELRTGHGRAFLQRLELSAEARERIEIGLAMIEAIDA
jgi:hypothetical protein